MAEPLPIASDWIGMRGKQHLSGNRLTGTHSLRITTQSHYTACTACITLRMCVVRMRVW